MKGYRRVLLPATQLVLNYRTSALILNLVAAALGNMRKEAVIVYAFLTVTTILHCFLVINL